LRRDISSFRFSFLRALDRFAVALSTVALSSDGSYDVTWALAPGQRFGGRRQARCLLETAALALIDIAVAPPL
jgi:hypothetical protein